MKKVISAIITASMLAASLVTPAFADYTASDYDVRETKLTFDDGTATNAIDGTPAKKLGTEIENVYTTTIDSTKEFFFSFDFCFDSEDGYFETPSNSNKDKVGLTVTYNKTSKNIRTNKDSSNYQELGEIAIGQWYRAEIEGVTGGGKGAVFRLYDGTGALVQETKGLSFRNLASAGRHFTYLNGKNISVDNIGAVQFYPDALNLTSESDEVDAGQTLPFSYKMTRQTGEITQYGVEWSVYDQTGASELSGDLISITSEGVLVTSVKAPGQVVTVKASSTFGTKTLVEEKKITINGVDVSNEKFDDIVITGDKDTLKAGTSIAFGYTASKNGADVTSDLAAGDVVWSVYDCDDINPNNNKNITMEDGLLTVADGVLPQEIYVHASTESGKVFASKKVTIEMSDSQKEKVILSDACEKSLAGTQRVESVDGSKAYKTTAATSFSFSDQSDYTLVELDIKLGGDGSGMIFKNNSGGKINSSFVMRNGSLSQETSTGKYAAVYETEADKWYHFEIIYKAATETKSDNVSMNIYEWNDERTEYAFVVKKTGLDDRNGNALGQVEVQSGTTIDNLKISTPAANEVKLTAPGESIFAGESKQFTATASRNGLPFAETTGLTWSVLDKDMLPILNGTVSIDSLGLLTASNLAAEQEITVRVSSASGAHDDAKIKVLSREIFEVTNIGIDESGKKIVRLYLNKKFAYDDDATFIITITGADNKLKDVKLIKTFGDRISMGETEVSTDYDLPSDFNPAEDKVEVMVWTTL